MWGGEVGQCLVADRRGSCLIVRSVAHSSEAVSSFLRGSDLEVSASLPQCLRGD